ncbi:MAG: hypothetical protein EOO99_06400 [Pedobacter sp.]|nr:MAG: hypothetical protein EOO99_06400 [Pedobacter sp.]
MTNIYELDNRVLVPNWRDFQRTVKIGELGQNDKPKGLATDLVQIKADWKNNKTIGIAADLVNNSFVSNDLFSEELKEAIQFVENNKSDSSLPLLALVEQIKQEINPIKDSTTKLLEKNVQSLEEFRSLFDNNMLNRIISKTKNLTKSYLDNAIYWIELARLYTIKGQRSKADKCILIALQLAPNNRFVLRSSTRFFIHNQEEEKAIYYLKKATAIRNDPWLISAHIASSNLIGRYSPFIKTGIGLINSNNFSSFDLTELSSSLGTLEFKNGAFKKSIPLLNLSLSNPNDNSLAQFEWLSKKDQRLTFDPTKFDDVKNPFEAFAYENFGKGEFNRAFYNCIDWFLDIPFSKRSLMFASYIATIIGQNDSAILLCLVGLRLDPQSMVFLNNLIYNYCVKGDLVNAEKYTNYLANIARLQDLFDREKIMLQATLGLFYLRTGSIEQGKDLYKQALENSKAIKNDNYHNQALLNFTRELYLINDGEYPFFLEKLKQIQTNDVDIKYLQKQVLDVVNSNLSRQ